MKKFLSRVIMTALIVSALCFAACFNDNTGGGGGGTGGGNGGDTGGGTVGETQRVDTAKDNKEFVAFRTKAVNIIKDAGLYVYDFDEQNNSSKSALAAAPGFSANATEIGDKITADRTVVSDIDSVISLRDEMFEQSFYVSLYIGDGLATYHNVNKFYGIPVAVSEWSQYFTVTEENGVNTVMCYTPYHNDDDYSQSENFIYLKIDYKSKSDYYYEFVQYVPEEINIRYNYAFGDSNKRFLGVEVIEGRDVSGYVVYAENESEGYRSQSYDLAHDCLQSYLRPLFNSIDTEQFKALTDADYLITDEQLSELNKKYFGHDFGIADNDNQGIQTDASQLGLIARGYVAGSDETEVTIPENVAYLADDFTVWSKNGTVEKLVIPASVKGAAHYENNGQARVVELSELDIRLVDEEIGLDKRFCSFEVAKGSPVFRAGTGSLYSLGGELIYLADSPLSEFDISLFDEKTMPWLELYKHLFDNIDEVTIDLAIDFETLGKTYEVLGKLRPPEKINFTASKDADPGNRTTLNLDIDGNITLDVDVRNRAILEVYFGRESRGTVTVNLHALAGEFFFIDGESRQLRYVVNTDCSEEVYNATFGRKGNIGHGDNVTFNYGATGAETFDDFDAVVNTQYEEDIHAVVTLRNVADGATVNVPETYMTLPVRTLRINGDLLTGKSARIVLSKNIRQIELISDELTPGEFYEPTYPDGTYRGTLRNENVVIVYGGDFEFFEVNYHPLLGALFSVECTDGVHVYSRDAISENPPDDRLTATLNVFGTEYEIKFQRGAGQEISLEEIGEIDTMSNIERSAFMGSDKRYYALLNDGGVEYWYIYITDVYEDLYLTFFTIENWTVNVKCGDLEASVPLDNGVDGFNIRDDYEDGTRTVYLQNGYGGNREPLFVLPQGKMLENSIYGYNEETLWNVLIEREQFSGENITLYYTGNVTIELPLVDEYDVTVRFESWLETGPSDIWDIAYGESDVERSYVRGQKITLPETLPDAEVNGVTYKFVHWEVDDIEKVLAYDGMCIVAIYEAQ